MAVALDPPTLLHPIAGVRLGAVAAGVRKPGRRDVLLLALDAGSRVAGVFTQNRFAAPPVGLCRERLAATTPIRALVINAGNANAATGEAGRQDAIAVCSAVAEQLGVAAESVLPFSTGVIGERLPVERICRALPDAVAALDAEQWLTAAQTIMTTDTVAKGASRQVHTSAGVVSVTGIAKGAGMIHPNMATMLGFVATDAALAQADLDALLRRAVARSFNLITVDGDTSTNDSCVLVASGRCGAELQPGSADYARVEAAIMDVFAQLAQAIVRDAEGATKFVSIGVRGARSEDEAIKVGFSVAHSPLVKTALYASDPNWGRIVCAIGNAGIADLQQQRVSLWIDDVALLVDGQLAPGYREEQGAAIFARAEFSITADLGRGEASATVWTCDLSLDYVRINADYRS